ncbi:MAG: hypothetical protein R3B84_03775 [Zavarzinella sp.]
MHKHFLFATLVACFTLGGASAQPIFSGGVTGHWNFAVGGEFVDGFGTPSLTFAEFGLLEFTPANSVTAGPQPFLIGKVQFNSGLGIPSEARLSIGLSVISNETGTVWFCPKVELFPFEEPGLIQGNAIFSPDQTWTSRVDGQAYELAFLGLTDGATLDDSLRPILQHVQGDDPAVGYLWATLNDGNLAKSSNYLGCYDCGEPPVENPDPHLACQNQAVG